uniref:Group XV phospholipase A2-like n=1 Tax=Hirondellea gigas TaxID=1518452 RepID=A0A6A7FRB0_9CRUS
MKLVYDSITRTTHDPRGVSVRVPGFGNTSTVEYLNEKRYYSYFAYVADTLVSLGYERNKNLRGAPFDFRKAPNELSSFFVDLRQLTEELRESTGGPVVLVAHSLGAPILNYFLNQHTQAWRDEHVLSLVSLAGAWGGAVKAVKVYAAGDNMGAPLNSLTMRTQQRTNPSLAFLLPDPELWGDHVMVKAPGGNYTVHQLKQFLHDLQLPDSVEMYEDTRGLLNMSNTPPRVPLHCLYGTGIPTVERLEYASGGYFPDYPKLINGPGDGTVNLRSAALCYKYASLQSQPVSMESFNKTDHMGILKNNGVLHYIANIVTAEACRRTVARQNAPAGRSRVSRAAVSATSSPHTENPMGEPSSVGEKLSGRTQLEFTDVDINDIIARLDEEIRLRKLEDTDELDAYEELKLSHNLNKQMEYKMLQAQEFKLTLEKLQRRQEKRELRPPSN